MGEAANDTRLRPIADVLHVLVHKQLPPGKQ